MKLSNIDFVSSKLGDYLSNKKDPNNLDIHKLLTNLFKKESFNSSKLLGFSYTKEQFEKIQSLVKSDKNAISKIDDNLKQNYETNIRFNWMLYCDFYNLKKGKYESTYIVKLTPKEMDNIVGHVEQDNSVEDYIYQECNYFCYQFAGNFSYQKATNESKQECGDYSIQYCEHDSYQNSGSYCEVTGGITVNQETGNHSKLRSENDSTQIAGNNCLLITKDFSKQQFKSYCTAKSSNKTEIECDDFNIIETGSEAKILCDSFNKITTNEYAIIKAGENCTIDTHYKCQVKAKEDTTISFDEDCTIELGNNSHVIRCGDSSTIILNGDNLVIDKTGMFLTVIVNSSYGQKRFESHTDFSEFSKLIIENGEIVS